MKHILTILLSSLLIYSCSTARDVKCRTKKQHNGIPKGFLSVSQNRTPVNIQVRVTEVISRTNRVVECKTVSMDGRVIMVRYFSGGIFASTKRIQIGTKLTLHGYSDFECDKWQPGRIQINN